MAAVSILVQLKNRWKLVAGIAQAAVGTVLDDRDIVFIAQIQQRTPLFDIHRYPGGILEIRYDINKLRRGVPAVQLFNLTAKAVDVGTVIFNINTCKNGPLHLKGNDRTGKSRPVEKDGITWI